MKKCYAFLFLFASVSTVQAQNICDPAGNVVIYSNYDGGELNIDVDQNIPNLKIGIVTYEYVHVTISGAFASNVTAVRYAGYNANNNHCSIAGPTTTTITGVPNSVDTIILYPAATYSNPNGYSSIICNYSCSDSTNQGGCNTPDQIAHYFLTVFGGTLFSHHTSYGCWSGSNTRLVSLGGNCCINPLSTGIAEENDPQLATYPNPADASIRLDVQGAVAEPVTVTLRNMLGEIVYNAQHTTGAPFEISTAEFAAGLYTMEVNSASLRLSRLVSVAH